MRFRIIIISVLLICFVQINAQTSQCDNSFVQFVGERKNDFEFDVVNNTQDTLYLFDSYLNENLYNSEYLHRFDAQEKQCKLSLLPLLPFLSVQHADRVILEENRVVHKGQVLFHFRAIPPNGRSTIFISKNAIYSQDYVKEVYPKRISKFVSTIKFRKSKHKKCSAVVVEFALYQKIDLLISKDAYYLDEFNFNEQALSYSILSVMVD